MSRVQSREAKIESSEREVLEFMRVLSLVECAIIDDRRASRIRIEHCESEVERCELFLRTNNNK